MMVAAVAELPTYNLFFQLTLLIFQGHFMYIDGDKSKLSMCILIIIQEIYFDNALAVALLHLTKLAEYNNLHDVVVYPSLPLCITRGV